MTTTDDDRELRRRLSALLESDRAHVPFARAVKGLGPELAGRRVAGLPHTAWELIEHVRIAGWDILEFSRRADHESPRWPEGYWPPEAAPPDAEALQQACARVIADRQALRAMIEDPEVDPFAPFPWADGANLVREALLLADHDAYHVGQIVLVRQALGDWE